MSLPRLTELMEQQNQIKVSPVAQTTTNSYVDLAGSTMKLDAKKLVSYVITAATNNILYKVLASNDNVIFGEVKAETALSAGNTEGIFFQDAPYDYYKMQIKAAVGGSQGEVTIRGCVK